MKINMIYMSLGMHKENRRGGHKVLAVCTQEGGGGAFWCVQRGGVGGVLEIDKKCVRN